MGNQVVFSVSHDHLDALENIEGMDFGDLARQIHESPSIPRFLTGDTPSRMLAEGQGVPGIAFSHYSHASDGVVVAVSSQGITQPSMAFALTTKEIEGGRLSILKGLKRTSKYMLNEPHSVRKMSKPGGDLEVGTHNRCTVFGYLTDNSHSLHDDPTTLSKIIAHMRDPQQNRLPHAIKKITEIEPGEQVFVKMHGNCFIPSEHFKSGNGMTFENWSSEMTFDQRGRMSPKESDIWCCRQMMEGLGYSLSPLREKESTKEKDDGGLDR